MYEPKSLEHLLSVHNGVSYTRRYSLLFLQKNQFSNLETIYCGGSLALLPKSQGYWLEYSAFG